jgi:hypothetical protein
MFEETPFEDPEPFDPVDIPFLLVKIINTIYSDGDLMRGRGTLQGFSCKIYQLLVLQ